MERAQLSGETVVVTGGGSGLGRAVCELAAAEGARVAVLDRRVRAARATVARLDGAEHVALAVDVADRAGVHAAVEQAAATLGPPSGLVACAGVSARRPLEALEPAELHALFDVNVFGAIYAIQAVVPAMRAARRGAVVTVSSVAAHTGGGFLGGAHYAASKAALIGLTKGLARELAPAGIRVNALAPGPVATPMLDGAAREQRRAFADATLLRRLGRPHEIASAAVFLLSDASAYVTGETLNVNGGAYLA